MVIVSLTFSPRKDVREEVLTAGAEMVKASQADPGCITFSVSTDLLDSNVMRLYEEWENPQVYEDHHQTSHSRRFQTTMAELGENAMNVHSVAIYEATSLES